MRRNILLAGVLSIGVVTLLLAQTQPPNQPPGQPPRPGQPVRTGETDQNKDAKFLAHQYQCGLFEIAAGREAMTRADRPDVKEFAKLMVDAHTQMNQQIKETAQKKNVQIPMDMMDWQQALLNQMKQVQGEDFSRGYMFGQVGGHHIAALANRCAVNHCQDPDIKNLAQRNLPEVQKHLAQAEKIADELAGGAAGRRMTEGKDNE